jgi:GNAT superfamily N-acetyltransferase
MHVLVVCARSLLVDVLGPFFLKSAIVRPKKQGRLDMNREMLADALVTIELKFAHFNAQRTSRSEFSEPNIDLESCCISDKSRPNVAYYNRAVVRSSVPFLGTGLVNLSSKCTFELWPNAAGIENISGLQAKGFRPTQTLSYLFALPNDASIWGPSVSRLERNDADRFLDLLLYEGVTFSEEKKSSKRKFYCTDQFQVFVAEGVDKVPCAWGTMFVAGKSAYLGNDFTRPEYRKKGHHTALIAARVKHAFELGLDSIFLDVEFASSSHQNFERAGFRLLTVNTLWETTSLC